MYEWENEISAQAIESRCAQLRSEIKRISNTTLRGNFRNPEDRTYWERRLSKLNGELLALEKTV